jgi:hypothetical protein
MRSSSTLLGGLLDPGKDLIFLAKPDVDQNTLKLTIVSQVAAVYSQSSRRGGSASGDFGLPISYCWFRLLLPSAIGLQQGWLD